jgi:hypothetical protein
MAKRRAVLDRIESSTAVLESESHEIFEIPASALPVDARPGDWLILEDDSVSIDRASTAKARRRVRKLMDDVWND